MQVSSYARDILDTDYKTSISILLVMNGLGVPGRLLPNIIADRYLGSINIMALSSFNGAIIVFSWAAVRSLRGLWIFAAFFGFFSAGVQSLFLASCLTGTPLGGALVHANDGCYLYVQIWTGLSMLTGTLFLALSKTAADKVMSKAAEAEKGNGQ
jgi:hypothetical protein